MECPADSDSHAGLHGSTSRLLSSRHPRASPPQIWSCANTWWKKQEVGSAYREAPLPLKWPLRRWPQKSGWICTHFRAANVKWIFKRALTTVVACTRCPLKKAVLSALWTDARDFVKGDGLSKEVLRWPEVPWAARIGELVFRMVVKLLKRLGPVVVVTRKKSSSSQSSWGMWRASSGTSAMCVKGWDSCMRFLGKIRSEPRRGAFEPFSRTSSQWRAFCRVALHWSLRCLCTTTVSHAYRWFQSGSCRFVITSSPAHASMWTWLVKRAWNTFMGLLSQPQNPLQLWSRSFPCGVPNLTNLNQKKIDTANAICKYQQNSEKGHGLHRAHRKSKEKLYVAHVMDATACTGGWTFSNFFSTMCTEGKETHGALSTLYSNCKEFAVLAKEGDQSHAHDSWGASMLRKQWELATAHEGEDCLALCDDILAVAQH